MLSDRETSSDHEPRPTTSRAAGNGSVNGEDVKLQRWVQMLTCFAAYLERPTDQPSDEG